MTQHQAPGSASSNLGDLESDQELETDAFT
jgi:hypothetical protein